MADVKTLVEIDLNERFKIFLKSQGLNMLPVEKHRAMKKAFMAGCNEIMLVIKVIIPTLPEEEGIQVLNKMVDSVNEYWQSQAKHGV